MRKITMTMILRRRRRTRKRRMMMPASNFGTAGQKHGCKQGQVRRGSLINVNHRSSSRSSCNGLDSVSVS